MNLIQRLHSKIKVLIEMGLLDDVFGSFETKLPECNSIEELNDAIETEFFYMAQDADK